MKWSYLAAFERRLNFHYPQSVISLHESLCGEVFLGSMLRPIVAMHFTLRGVMGLNLVGGPN